MTDPKTVLARAVMACTALLTRAVELIDAMATARARRAVPEPQQRQARREIDRYRRLMRADLPRAAAQDAVTASARGPAGGR